MAEELNKGTKIAVKDIKSNMILSQDIITEDGSILLAKDTMLNNINFTKLRAYEVSHVFIRERSIDENSEALTGEVHTKERQKVPVETRNDYKEFVTIYDEKKEEVKKYIHLISDGEVINLNELYKLTDGIMSKLKCKSDVFTFISFIKDTSEHTFTHSSNVALLCNLFGHWLDLDEESMINLTTAGILHDIGKTKTPPHILNKKSNLSDDEFKIMKEHATHGYRILEKQDIPESIKLAALMHHEKIDGTGYPLGVKSDKISKLAKIVSIVDIYDAMTANRVYRGKICPFTVIGNFEKRGYGELDTEFLWVFLRNIAYTYIGSWVKLSDGREAEVVFINQRNLAKPIVRIDATTVLDLMYINDLNIVSLL